jgi:hypothetical protein
MKAKKSIRSGCIDWEGAIGNLMEVRYSSRSEYDFVRASSILLVSVWRCQVITKDTYFLIEDPGDNVMGTISTCLHR